MQTRFHPLAAAAVLAAALGAWAQTPASDMADGEVRKVDKAAARVTLRHGEIVNLDMPPMTMVFQLRDRAAAERLQPGDKVRFRAVKEGAAFVVTEIEPVR